MAFNCPMDSSDWVFSILRATVYIKAQLFYNLGLETIQASSTSPAGRCHTQTLMEHSRPATHCDPGLELFQGNSQIIDLRDHLISWGSASQDLRDTLAFLEKLSGELQWCCFVTETTRCLLECCARSHSIQFSLLTLETQTFPPKLPSQFHHCQDELRNQHSMRPQTQIHEEGFLPVSCIGVYEDDDKLLVCLPAF